MIKKYILIFCLFFSFEVNAQDEVMLTPLQMHKDLNLLKTAFVQLHPSIYRYNSPKQIDQYFKLLIEKTNRPLTNNQFFISLSQLAVKLHCGHTYVNPYNQSKGITNQLFSKTVIPFLFKIIDGKIVITHNLSNNSKILKGDEIISINGTKGDALIDSLLTVSRADGNYGLAKKLDNLNLSAYFANAKQYALFDIYFPLFFRQNFNASTYHLVIHTYKGERLIVEVKAVSKEQRQNIYQQKFKKEAAQPKWSFSQLNKQSSYLKLDDFSVWNWKKDYKKYLDSVFIQLRSTGIKNLIVDIRNNEGGDDEARNEVLTYLLKQPFVYQTKRGFRFLTFPDSLAPYLKTWDSSFKKPKPAVDYDLEANSLYYKKGVSSADTILPKTNHFTGRVFLLTNATNSSTSFFMADVLQQAKAATIIGETTGGSKQGINGGQFFFLNLPGSDMEIDIPLVWQAPINFRPDEGIKPNVLIQTKQSDVASGRDPVLKYLYDLTFK